MSSSRRPARRRQAPTGRSKDGRASRDRKPPATRGGAWRIRFACIVIGATLLAVLADTVALRQVSSLDVAVYRCYANGFWQGAAVVHDHSLHYCAPLWDGTPRRFHTLPREYPAASLAVFSLPLLTPWLSYTDGYILWMALILLIAVGLLAWRGPPEAAIAFPLYTLLAGWNFTLERYDLLPGLCVLLAWMLMERHRARAATAALAVGTLLKLFPIVLLPLLLIACKRGPQGRWRLDLVLLFAVICLAGSLPVLLIDSSALSAPIHFELSRPLHIESLPGSLLWLASNAGFGPRPGENGAPYAVFSYNSLNVAGGAQWLWGGICTLLGLIGLGVAYVRAWRGRDALGRGMILALILLLAGGKVLSPQYLLWIVPLAAVVEGIRLRWLVLSILVCGIILCYYDLPLGSLPWSGGFMTLIVIRNLLLCGLALLYLLMPGDLERQAWPARPLWRYLQ